MRHVARRAVTVEPDDHVEVAVLARRKHWGDPRHVSPRDVTGGALGVQPLRDLQVAVAMSCLYVLYAVCWLPTKALQRVFRR